MRGPAVLAPEHPAEQAVGGIADHAGEDEEADDLQQDEQDAVTAAGKAADEGEGNQTEHVVDQRGGEDGVADLRLELAHFLERFDRDADGGGRQDRADEDILEQVVAFDQADGVRAPRKARAHQQGDDHTQQGDPEAGPAAVFQLLHIRPHTGGEHQHHNTQLAEL